MAEPGTGGASTAPETNRVVSLLHATAMAANEATTAEGAMQTCVDAICSYTGWPVGHFYSLATDGSAQLLPSPVWHLDDPERFDRFRRVTQALRIQSGRGLPGRVLATGRPQWIADVRTDDSFPRAAVAEEAGLEAATALPVLVGTEVTGVLEFFFPGPAPTAPPLFDVMAQIGAQLGRVVERTRAAAELQESEERMRLVVETAGDAFIGMDTADVITDWNAAATATFGWSREEIIGRRLSETIIPLSYRQAHNRGLAHFLDTGEAAVFGNRLELEALHRDGHELPVELSIWPVRQARSVQFNAFVHDITERRQAKTALREANERFRAAFDDAPIGIVLVDQQGRFLQSNRAYCEMLGYGEDAILAMTVSDLTHPDDVASAGELFRRAVAGEVATYRLEKRYVHANGHAVWVLWSVSAVTGEDGIPYFIGQAEDITARKQLEKKLTRQALHDPLTGLPNRTLLVDRLHQAIARHRRNGAGLTVLFLDLDHFKLINDSFGHHAGDRVLSLVGERLCEAVRPADTVCRLGGDEFVVVCEGLEGGDAEARVVAARLEAAVAQPYQLGDQEVTVTASVGLVNAGAGHETPESLLRDADSAMYRAKQQGKARHQVFDDDLRLMAGERTAVERCLRNALRDGALGLVYQPIVELETGTVVGAEALLRCEDPDRGELDAAQIIEVAEDSGLIIPIGSWVLEQACRDAASWRSRGCAVAVTVNLGARQLVRSDLVDIVSAAVGGAGLEPAAMCLDVPEPAMSAAPAAARESLRALRAIGVLLGIDEWGTGGASVTGLTRFGVDYVKIDGALVSGVAVDLVRSETVAALVDVGRAFGLTTIAEGVETAEQLAELCRMGCRLGQGNHLAAPRHLDALVATATH